MKRLRTWQTARVWRARDAPGWLGLAASPAFALMAGMAAIDASETAMCGAASLSIGGMAWMNLMMSLFHVSPWLKLFRPPATAFAPQIAELTEDDDAACYRF